MTIPSDKARSGVLTLTVRKGHAGATDLWFALEDPGAKTLRQSVHGVYDRIAVVDVIAILSRRFNPVRMIVSRPGKSNLQLSEETLELIRSGKLTPDDFVAV